MRASFKRQLFYWIASVAFWVEKKEWYPFWYGSKHEKKLNKLWNVLHPFEWVYRRIATRGGDCYYHDCTMQYVIWWVRISADFLNYAAYLAKKDKLFAIETIDIKGKEFSIIDVTDQYQIIEPLSSKW